MGMSIAPALRMLKKSNPLLIKKLVFLPATVRVLTPDTLEKVVGGATTSRVGVNDLAMTSTRIG
jgi:hypothetical protein